MIDKTQEEIMSGWKNSGYPLVSIQCLTYNHEPYIRQALDGFLMQTTTFPFEIIIHDDASSDSTADIIREYELKFPRLIRPIYESENQMQMGTLGKIINGIQHRGKYIALCEGDDYWTEPLKLQRQVEYLKNHSNIVGCSCRYNTYHQSTGKTFLAANPYFDNSKNKDKEIFEFNAAYNFIQEWTTKTLTMVWRKDVYEKASYILENKNYKLARDVHHVFYTMQYGNCVCLNFIGGVYRISNKGVFGSLSKLDKAKTNYLVYKEFFKKEKNYLIRQSFLQRKIHYYREVCNTIYTKKEGGEGII